DARLDPAPRRTVTAGSAETDGAAFPASAGSPEGTGQGRPNTFGDGDDDDTDLQPRRGSSPRPRRGLARLPLPPGQVAPADLRPHGGPIVSGRRSYLSRGCRHPSPAPRVDQRPWWEERSGAGGLPRPATGGRRSDPTLHRRADGYGPRRK